MMLVEQTAVQDNELPVSQFKEHLRLGTGFDDDSLQDGLLISFLLAAIAAVEARTEKIVFRRSFVWTLNRWQSAVLQSLPVGPVDSIKQVSLIDAQGNSDVVNVDAYFLEQDTHRPQIVAAGACLQSAPNGGRIEISLTAGMATVWDDLPADMAHGIFLLASHYYENRQEVGVARADMPFGVVALLERYRPVRLGGGFRS